MNNALHIYNRFADQCEDILFCNLLSTCFNGFQSFCQVHDLNEASFSNKNTKKRILKYWECVFKLITVLMMDLFNFSTSLVETEYKKVILLNFLVVLKRLLKPNK